MQEKETSSFQVVRTRKNLVAHKEQDASARTFIIEESLGHQMNYMARLFTQLLGASLTPYGVYPGQWGVLLFLWVQDGQTQRELSRQVVIDEASMVRAIDRMERDGLVHRDAKPVIPPRVDYSLTGLGREAAEQVRGLAAWTKDRMDEVTEARGRYDARRGATG